MYRELSIKLADQLISILRSDGADSIAYLSSMHQLVISLHVLYVSPS